MNGAGGPPPRGLLWAVALASAAALAYEVLLTRLFAIIQWHHFAYMAIGLALLGLGASGSFLALAPRLRARAGLALPVNAALFGVSAVLCFAAAQRIPANPVEMLWDGRQFGLFSLVWLLIATPFFFAGNTVGLALWRYGAAANRVYAADLLGAGLGASGLILALYWLPPAEALRGVGAAGIVAGAVAAWSLSRRRLALACLLLAGGMAALPGELTTPRPTPYKPLAQALEVRGARVVAERSGPLGVVTAVENRVIPFRDAAGLALTSPAIPPPQIALYIDGEGPLPVNRFTGDVAGVAYLGHLTSAAPYALLARPSVLVLGAGGGEGVLQALLHGADRVTAVELNPDVAALVNGPLRDHAGDVYRRPGTRLAVDEARRFLAGRPERWELIQLPPGQGFATSAAGLGAMAESYLLTVESVRLMLDRLAPDGLLAFSRWVHLPPRDMVKLIATVVAALRANGVADPENRLALARGWQTATLLVRPGGFDATDMARLRSFCAARGFDLDYFPGARPEDGNRINVADRPHWYEAARALTGPGAAGFIARYKFAVAPATDDRPYFSHTLKWGTLRELLARPGGAGFPLLEWGYVTLVATALQAAVLAPPLILLPLLLGGRAPPGDVSRTRVLVYFTALGLGFLFIELAFIQRLVLFLAHPTHAVAVALAGFLVFAGLGSRHAARLEGRAAPVRRAAYGIVLLALAYPVLLPALSPALMTLPEAGRILAALALIAPPAFLMGIPFATALTRLDRTAPALIPWAWGINGCASVIAAAGGTLIALHFGLTALAAAGAAAYLLAAASYPRLRSGAVVL